MKLQKTKGYLINYEFIAESIAVIIKELSYHQSTLSNSLISYINSGFLEVRSNFGQRIDATVAIIKVNSTKFLLFLKVFIIDWGIHSSFRGFLKIVKSWIFVKLVKIIAIAIEVTDIKAVIVMAVRTSW